MSQYSTCITHQEPNKILQIFCEKNYNDFQTFLGSSAFKTNISSNQENLTGNSSKTEQVIEIQAKVCQAIDLSNMKNWTCNYGNINAEEEMPLQNNIKNDSFEAAHLIPLTNQVLNEKCNLNYQNNTKNFAANKTNDQENKIKKIILEMKHSVDTEVQEMINKCMIFEETTKSIQFNVLNSENLIQNKETNEQVADVPSTKEANVDCANKINVKKKKYKPSIIKQKKFQNCDDEDNAKLVSISYLKNSEDASKISKKRKKKLTVINISNGSKKTIEVSVRSSQELVVSKALEEVGITESMLKQSRKDNKTKFWLCFQNNCSQQFNKLCAFKAHLLSHFCIKPFKCDFEGCSWAFYSEFKLKRHKETHLKRKDFTCSISGCTRKFTTIYNLASHEKLHTRPNRISCQVPDCTAKFQTKRALEIHMKTHDESLAPYVCHFEGCGKRYYGSNALTSHQRCHSYTEKDVTCSWPECGKIFDQPCRLKAHMRSHTGCKPYACTFKGCKWAFTSSSKLKRHQKKHTNERKFICDYNGCGKAFMRSEHLKEHKFTHTEERLFYCNECNCTFSARSSLYVHIKKHSGKKGIEKKKCQIKEALYNSEDNNYKNKSELKSACESIESECDSINQSNLINSEASLDKYSVDTYFCPVETCTTWYPTKEILKSHLQNEHLSVISDSDDNFTNLLRNKDVTLYSAPCEEENEQYNSLILNESINSSLQDTNNRDLDLSSHSEIIEDKNKILNSQKVGSARTSLTYTEVLNMKLRKNLIDSDCNLDVPDYSDNFLLENDLSVSYCQENAGISGYQVLFLDTESHENLL